jgi:RNase P/RNase MRP subunit p30
MIDIVFPNKNEQEFEEMAKKLGIELLFVYKDNKNAKALLVEPKDVRKTHDKKIMAICTASREAIEREADIVYGFELLETREHTHYRASGMNQVLCKLAADKKVKIGFSFSEILNTYGQKRAIIMGRMAQNIMFCQKYKTPIKIASFATEPYQMRAEAELKAFFKQLGMTG